MTIRTFVDRGFAGPVPPLEIFENQRDVRPVEVQEMSGVNVLTGGPESLVDLASAGLLPSGPVVLAGDASTALPGAGAIVTDGLRRRDVSFGAAKDAVSATLSRNQALARTSPTHDYLPSWGEDWLTVASYRGIAGVTASSSWGGFPDFAGARPAFQPYSAVDGDPETSWRTAPLTPVNGQWLEIGLASPQVVPEVRLAFDMGAANVPTTVVIETDREVAQYSGLSDSAVIKLRSTLPASRVRIVIKDSLPRGLPADSGSVGLAEVAIPGIEASRQLIVPRAFGSSAARDLVFSAAPRRSSCFFAQDRPVCDPNLKRDSEDGKIIARQFTLAEAGRFEPAVWAQPRPGQALDFALRTNIFVSVSASSSLSPEPAVSAAAAIDGNPATVWRPAGTDAQPWLRYAWLGEKVIEGIRVELPEGVAASHPEHVQVIGDGGVRTGFLDANGVFDFGFPMRTDEVTVSFLDNQDAVTYNYLGGKEILSVGVAELSIWKDPRPPTNLQQLIDLPCGSGPTVHFGGQSWQTRLSATRQQLVELREIPAQLCGDNTGKALSFAAGPNEITVTASDVALPSRVAFKAGGPAGVAPIGPQVVSWSQSERKVNVPADQTARIIGVRENTNKGWRATLNGRTLTPIVVDGWQQGWVIPPGPGGTITLSFVPERTFQVSLLIGAGTLLLVLIAALLPGRRRLSHGAGRHRFRREGLFLFASLALLVVGGWVAVLIAVGSTLIFLLARWIYRRKPPHDQIRLRRGARWLWLLPPVLFLLGGWPAHGPSYRVDQIWPQVASLAAITTLWLSAYWVRRSGPRPAQPVERSLDAVPADRREHEAAGHGRGQ
jgi:arabinofuranan 3-O-arabinosyltransferase